MCAFAFLMVSCRYCTWSSFFFSFLRSVFKFADFFFCLIKSAVEALLLHFSFHLLCSSAPEFLFGSTLWFLSLFFSCIIFLNSLCCLSVFSWIWASLKFLWILFQVTCSSPFFGVSYLKFMVFFCFLDLLFLLALHWYLHYWGSSHIF